VTIARELEITLSEVGRMPFSEVMDFAEDFNRFPPRHVSAAISIGWGPKGEGRSSDEAVPMMRGPMKGT
jgi:hypothetical protein